MPLALGAASSVGGSFHQQVAAVCASWSYPHAGINSATRERESSDRRPTDVGQQARRFSTSRESRAARFPCENCGKNAYPATGDVSELKLLPDHLGGGIGVADVRSGPV